MVGAGMSRAIQETPEEQTATDLSYDDCFDMLSNHRRRYTLHYIQQHDDSATIGELSDQIAAWENGIGIEEVSYDQRKRVYTSLQQVHLPRMDDAGVVDFDDREGVVRVGPAAEKLEIYLEIVGADDISWAQLYAGLAAVSAGLIVAGVAGAPLLRSVPAFGWAVFVLTTFTLTSLVHAYYNRVEMSLHRAEEPPTVR